jgi:hypothetical protein
MLLLKLLLAHLTAKTPHRTVLTVQQVELPDGTRLSSRAAAAATSSIAAAAVEGIQRIHPAFRVIALARPPSRAQPWVTHETLQLFDWHTLPQLSAAQIGGVLADRRVNFQTTSTDFEFCL